MSLARDENQRCSGDATGENIARIGKPGPSENQAMCVSLCVGKDGRAEKPLIG